MFLLSPREFLQRQTFMFLQLGCLAVGKLKKRVFRHFIVCLHLFTDLFHSFNFIFIISLKYSVFKLSILISISKFVAADEFSDILNLWNPR